MGRENYKTIKVVAVFLLLLFAACKKDKPVNPGSAPVSTSPGNGVYVVCEGSQGNGNGSLSLYNAASGVVNDDVYKSANGGNALGDVFQSLTLIDDRFFLCVNNSDKIVVINKEDHKQVGAIDIAKPRYILKIDSVKAYVSSLFSNKVYIINTRTLEVTGSITMPYQNPEGMVLLGENAYIATWDTTCNKIFRINTVTDKIDEEITVAGFAPQEIFTDIRDNLWVLSGNVQKGKPAALTCINPATGNIIKSFPFPSKADPIRPVFNVYRDKLYLIEVNYDGGTENNGIYSMHIDDNALPATPMIAAKQFQYFWALGIRAADNRIYVGDPKGFVQKGTIYVYDDRGNQVSQFDVGVGPGHFYFEE